MDGKKKSWKRSWKKQTAAVLAVAALLTAAPMGTPCAEAGWGGGWGDILGDVINGAINASNARMQFLAWGNNPVVQAQLRAKVVKEQSEGEPDAQAVAVTDKVMNRLVDNGNYVLKNDSLPFRWEVIHKDEFNANCNFADFVCVYDGLVKACNYDEDELAAVLGHEMAHGYNQHVAKDMQKRALSAVFANGARGALSASTYGIGMQLPTARAHFAIVKNTTLASEKRADESGFYTMASAGFNPGGAAAMMARMAYYTDHASQLQDFFFPSDHPDTLVRRDRMAALMTNYGIGHPTVGKDEKTMGDVYFDKKLLLRAEPESGRDAEEMSYLIAGGIAKGFHDHRTFAEWAFHTDAKGQVDFLNDDNAYGPLKRALSTNGNGVEFQTLVEQAYESDRKSNARDKFLKDERKHNDDVKAEREKQAAASKESPQKAQNGDLYMQLGLTDLAEKEYQRSEKLDAQNPQAKCGLAMVEGRRGHQAKALSMVNDVLVKNPKYGNAYVARAAIYANQGNLDAALADCNNALSVDKNAVAAYRVAGDIFNAQGNTSGALDDYRAYHNAVPEARDIPQEYLAQLTD